MNPVSKNRLLCFATLLWASTLIAQDDPTPEPVGSKTTQTIQSLQESINGIEAQIEIKRKERQVKGLSPNEQTTIDKEIDQLGQALAAEHVKLDSVVTGIDVKSFRRDDDTEVKLEDEVRQLIRPLLRTLKQLTERPRETEALRDSLATLRKDSALATAAVEHITTLQAETKDEPLKTLLEEKLKQWTEARDQTDKQLSILDYQLEERLNSEQSIWKTVSSASSAFFRSRGKNALAAIGLALATFFILRFIHSVIHRISPIRKRGRRSLLIRFVDVIYYLFTIATAIGAGMAGLYFMGDWMLLGLSLIFVTGLLWASKQSLTLFFDQVRLMLNLGSTREGERVLFQGIPWEVKSIRLYTDLVNPKLRGGHLRVPLREILLLVSRAASEDEPIFPCSEGDWLLLSDGTFGKIIMQSPDWVRLVLLGGSRKNYSTADFLTLAPQNLSTGFRLQIIFGIDYRHQAKCTDEIPRLLQVSVESGLNNLLSHKELVHLRVEFADAAASSLNYAIIGDFKGSAAPQYTALQRAIPRFCVEACNQHGWNIPFTQITLHQAACS